jgi:hypothetical protein
MPEKEPEKEITFQFGKKTCIARKYRSSELTRELKRFRVTCDNIEIGAQTKPELSSKLLSQKELELTEKDVKKILNSL